ncbi:MAG: alanyl-tRNA synthetase [Candidatus Atribacteria bacterium]|nr:alanyl-tRNA synthetase [Candidatus Atribacteria bacterium]
MKLKSKEIGERFLRFFEKLDHRVLPSASLIPDDQTLLLTIAGMVPFKPIFLGKLRPNFSRACTIQKCVRVSDLENVGFTPRHHTFFEMLGNFSFGDYFKQEACQWSWEFLTKELALPPEKIWVSVHQKDQESSHIWQKMVGVPLERIVFLSDEDNFWAAGPVGPCGFCSEIYFDLGEKRGCGRPDCKPGCDCDRYLEIWNLVFMEFDRQADGTLLPLPQKNIDTGMGLERITSVVQEAESNFETDLFLPIIQDLEKLSGCSYSSLETRPFFRVVADHIRAITFLIGDGVYPANEGRGYVLRRLIRRAHRFGRKISLDRPFLHQLIFSAVQTVEDRYPELKEKEKLIIQITLQEERRFEETLLSGGSQLDSIIKDALQRKQRIISGREIFRLYDTYGFPPDVAQEILAESGLSFREEEFAKEMESQKNKARQSVEIQQNQLKAEKEIAGLFSGLTSQFVGYHSLTSSGSVLGIARVKKRVSQLEQGEEGLIVLDKTSFYPERGGQEWDTGYLVGAAGKMEINQVFPGPGGVIIHQGVVKEGCLRVGDTAFTLVNPRRRKMLEAHHTVTHLLHRALREILGPQVKQAGSWVGETGLRFDFTHFSPLTAQEVQAIEAWVNERIFDDIPVSVTYSNLEEVQRRGVIALFEEKYDPIVRVVRIGNYTAELCGGTHLERTAQANGFKIISESSIGSGLRRIEAIAGIEALNYFRERGTLVDEIKETLNLASNEITSYVSTLVEENKQLKKELQKAKVALAIQEILSQVSSDTEKSLVEHLFSDSFLSIDLLREIVDQIGGAIKQGIVILGVEKNGKIQGIVAGINLPSLNLSQIVKSITRELGGGGGGKPTLAQFGGFPKERWRDLISRLREISNEKMHGN